MTRFQVALALVSCLVLDNGMRWGEAAQRWQWQDAVAILDEAGVQYHLLTRPRGGSKTTDLGAILIAVMLAQVRDGARLYTLAADRDQGRLILSAMRGFVVRTPILEGALVFSGHRVSVPGRDIVLEVLAADAASSWGLIPDFTTRLFRPALTVLRAPCRGQGGGGQGGGGQGSGQGGGQGGGGQGESPGDSQGGAR